MSTPTFDSERVYAAAAAGYAELSEQLWPWAAAGLAARVRGLPSDASVLDAGCGPGGVTVRVAELLGPRATVIGVDVCEEMLDHARQRAQARSTSSIVFQPADMNALDEADLPPSFSAVTAGLSLFLAPDIPATAAGLWRRVRPGGRLAVSVVSEQFFTPAFDQLLDTIRDTGNGLSYIPWRRVDHPDTLRAALADAGIGHVSVDVEIRQIPLSSPADWTGIMDGTGIRALLDDLDDDARRSVRAASVATLEEHARRTLAFGVLYAVADKPR